MPKPLKRRPGQVVHVAARSVVLRPALAIDIANIAAQWTKLEHTISLPFTTILAGQEPSAFEAYHELFEVSLRHKLYLAAAKRKGLPNDLIQESVKLHQSARTASSQRNRVVHGTWAYCDDLPDSLLLCDPSAINRRVEEFLSQFHERVDKAESNSAIEPWSFDFNVDDFDEYRHNDFEEIAKRTLEIDATAMAYWQKIILFSIQHERARRARRTQR
jgi:hypothetical protein